MKFKILMLAVVLGFGAFGNAHASQNVDCETYGNMFDCSQIRSDVWCKEKTGNPLAVCSSECGLYCGVGECDGDEFIGEFEDAYSYNPGDGCACNGGKVLKCPSSREDAYNYCSEHTDATCVFGGMSGTQICGRSVDGAPDSHLCSLCGVSSGTSTTSASTYINKKVTTTCSVSNYVVSATSSSPIYSCKSNAYGTATSATDGCYQCPDNATCNGSATFTCDAGYYKSGNACTQCPTATSTYTNSGLTVLVRGTSAAGATKVEDCYIPGGDTTYYDSTGTKKIVNACHAS